MQERQLPIERPACFVWSQRIAYYRAFCLVICCSLIGACDDIKSIGFGRVDRSDWNVQEIEWQAAHETDLLGSALSRPSCVVIYASWCKHCETLSRKFHDIGIVSLSKKFSMILADVDESPEFTDTLSPDGKYVPRIIFLDTSGQILNDVVNHTRGSHHAFGYGGASSEVVIHSMRHALQLASDGGRH